MAVALLVLMSPTATPALAQDPGAASDLPAIGASSGTVTLAGIVTNNLNDPLLGAEIRASDGSYIVTARNGRFVLPVAAADTVHVLIRRIGYRPAVAAFQVQAGMRVELAVKLVPTAVQLGTIVIEGEPMDLQLWRSGYYTRERAGLGTYFGPEHLMRHGGSLGNLLREAPSVTIEGSVNREVVLAQVGMRTCELEVLLDGVLVKSASSFGGLSAIVNKQDVLAIEVYTSRAGIPASLPRGAIVGECGVIAIWTKRWRS